MQLLLAGVEPRQNDRDRRPRRMRGPPQITHQCGVFKRNRDALDRWIGSGRARLIAGQHTLMRGKILCGIVREEMFRVVKVDRCAQIGFGCGNPAIVFCGFDCKVFVPRRLLAPDAAPVIPALDPFCQSLQVVWIHARRQITRRHVRKHKIDLRIARHETGPDLRHGGATRADRAGFT
jgi:hypothetical protein